MTSELSIAEQAGKLWDEQLANDPDAQAKQAAETAEGKRVAEILAARAAAAKANEPKPPAPEADTAMPNGAINMTEEQMEEYKKQFRKTY